MLTLVANYTLPHDEKYICQFTSNMHMMKTKIFHLNHARWRANIIQKFILFKRFLQIEPPILRLKNRQRETRLLPEIISSGKRRRILLRRIATHERDFYLLISSWRHRTMKALNARRNYKCLLANNIRDLLHLWRPRAFACDYAWWHQYPVRHVISLYQCF